MRYYHPDQAIFEAWDRKPEKPYDWRKAVEDATTLEEIKVVWDRLFGGQVKTGRKTVTEDFHGWLDSALKGEERKDYALLGYMGEKEIAFLERMGKKPESMAIIVNDRLVSGKKAKRHKADGDALTEDEWRMLPDVIKKPEKILYDKTNGRLLYVHPAIEDPRKIKIVVQADKYIDKLKKTINEVTTVFKIDGNALVDRTRYEVIQQKSD